MAKKRRQSALWIGVIGIVVLVIVYLIIQNSTALEIGGMGVLVLLILLRFLPDLIEGHVNRKLKEEKRAIRGAKAEEKVGELLEDLSEEYYVLNDVESPYGNIDHIVIGINNGVFLIETKAHGGKVEVQGETVLVNRKIPEKNYIAQTLKNSYWLRDEIGKVIGSKPWITPIIVFTNAFVPPTKPIKGVNIVNKKYLPNILQRVSKPNPINDQIWEHREEIGNNLRSSI